MKFPYFTQFGRDDGWYKVGPLARVQNCDFISTPLAEVERRLFIEASGGKICHAPLAYHWTRMIEMLHAAELIRDLLDDPDLLAGERVGSASGLVCPIVGCCARRHRHPSHRSGTQRRAA